MSFRKQLGFVGIRRFVFSFSGVALAAVGMAFVGGAETANAQNPVIDEWRSGSAHYDPFNDHLHIERERVRVRESALDPHRGHVDYGSRRYVDRYFRDRYGNLIREHGWTWTSHGVPHGKLTRTRVRYQPHRGWCGTGGRTSVDHDTVVYSQQGGRGGISSRERDTVVYGRPGGGVSERERDTVIYSHQGGRPGGVSQRERDTVIFGQGGRNDKQRSQSRNWGSSLRGKLTRQIGGSLFDR